MWKNISFISIVSVIFSLIAQGQSNLYFDENTSNDDRSTRIDSNSPDPLSLSHSLEYSDPEVLYYVGNALRIPEIECRNIERSNEYIQEAAMLDHAGALLHLHERALRNDDKERAKNYLVRAAAQSSPLIGRDFSLEAKYRLWRYASALGDSDLEANALNALLNQATDFSRFPVTGSESMTIRFEVAKLHFDREHDYHDIKLGLNLLAKLAELGHPYSISLLEDFEYIGLSESTDFDSFLRRVLLQAKENEARASHAVYILFFLGTITIDDVRSSFEISQENVTEQLLLYAAEAGSSLADSHLSMYYRRQSGSLDKMRDHRARALTAELPKALYQDGVERRMRDRSDAEARARILRSAELGYQQAQAAVAIECLSIASNFECSKSSPEYLTDLRNLSFNLRNYSASYFLGERYKHNIRGDSKEIELNYRDSFLALRIAATDSRNLKALREIADSYNRGIGSVRSEKHALIWFVNGYQRARALRQPIPKSGAVPSVSEAINVLLKKANMCDLGDAPCDGDLKTCEVDDGGD